MRKKPAPTLRPAAPSERESMLGSLSGACADEPDLLATVVALAEAGEDALLRLICDFRDNVPSGEILRRHGPEAVLAERLRVIHRVYVDQARRVREQSERPARARKCYESRMLARRDNYQAMLDDAGEEIPADLRRAAERLLVCARDKVPYDALPDRLASDALAIQEQVLQLRQRFKDWAAQRRVRAGESAPGGV